MSATRIIVIDGIYLADGSFRRMRVGEMVIDDV